MTFLPFLYLLTCHFCHPRCAWASTSVCPFFHITYLFLDIILMGLGLHTALSYSSQSTDTEEQEGTRRNRTFVPMCS